MIRVQVTYAQGLVKTFITSHECRLETFANAARKLGRIRSLRFQPDVSPEEAVIEAATGNAILLREVHYDCQEEA